MENMSNVLQGIFSGIGDFLSGFLKSIDAVFSSGYGFELIYTAVARWIFIVLAVFILLRAILSLLKSSSPSEVWAYLHLNTGENIPITHWENVIGRSKSCDINIDDPSVSRNHGTLNRDGRGNWT